MIPLCQVPPKNVRLQKHTLAENSRYESFQTGTLEAYITWTSQLFLHDSPTITAQGMGH